MEKGEERDTRVCKPSQGQTCRGSTETRGSRIPQEGTISHDLGVSDRSMAEQGIKKIYLFSYYVLTYV